MDGRKQCKGCGTQVAKPILCEVCGVAAHPGCMGRTGHPFSDGKFLGCDSASSSSSAGLGSEALLSRLQSMFSEEFRNFREEVLRLYHEEFEKINLELRSLRERLSVVERVESSAHAELPGNNMEDVIGEIAERERRSSSLIFFNFAESGSSVEHGINEKDDLARVDEVLSAIKPVDPPKVRVRRLGRKNDHSVRPIRVSFNSSSEALTILKGKKSYSGPAVIRKDLTQKQRQHYKDVRQQLQSLNAKGITNKTIRYLNGSPTIVDSNVNSNKKN